MPIKIVRKAKPIAADPVVPPAPAPNPKDLIEAYDTGPKVPAGPLLDGQYRVVRKTATNAVVAWYLIASYLYYVHDTSILSDALYDEMAKDMLDRWDEVTHPHKHLITQDDLRAGTLFGLKAENYPSMTKAAARQLVKGAWGLLIQI